MTDEQFCRVGFHPQEWRAYADSCRVKEENNKEAFGIMLGKLQGILSSVWIPSDETDLAELRRDVAQLVHQLTTAQRAVNNVVDNFLGLPALKAEEND